MKFLCSNTAKLMEVCRQKHTMLKDDLIDAIDTNDGSDDPMMFAIDIHQLVEAINDIENIMFAIYKNGFRCQHIIITEKQYESITYYGRKSISQNLFDEVVDV
nr:MAG TPA: hypothetical protein [Caudoviricetes sp.]DAX62835.1 MAG TPA: hypothetical protein [Caudoviricetes sp.]